MRKPKGMITFSLAFGIVLSIVGIAIIISKLHDVIIQNILQTELTLNNGTMNFDVWKTVDLEFKVYLFHVTNPEEVQNNGDAAILVEYGPYVYDVHVQRSIIGVDDSADAIEYVVKRTLFFNATKSGNYSEYDEITILNAAYIGTILTLAEKFPPFLATLGNNIPLLFPDQKSIFVRGKVKDILFDGLPLNCDAQKYPQIGMICGVLKMQAPPIVRAISDDGVYAYSFFNKLNATLEGPYTISRGTKDIYTVGYISKFKGEHYAEYWSEENCSVVKGSDSIFYPPMKSRESEIFTFASDVCRSIPIVYAKDVVYSGVLGYHYKTSKDLWNGSDSSCYCPRAADGTIMCPLPGSLNLDKCQKGPVLMTEPHFLHGASGLFSITEGLHPDEEKHAAYVIVDPMTGVPLSGYRKMQINMMLIPQPLDLLNNVTRGVFPILWVAEGLSPDTKMLEPIIRLHRVRRLLRFLTCIPFILGVIFVMYSLWMNPVNKTEHRTSGRIGTLAPKNTPNQSDPHLLGN